MSEWMPGAVQRPQPGGVTLDTSLPPRSIWHITWDALNAAGGQPDQEAVANYLISKEYCPHIMWNPFTGYMEQYYPASVGGRALAYNNQDGAACIQVEVFFTPGCVVNGVRYDTVADTPLVGFADLLAWADSLGIPRVWPMGAPRWQANKRDANIWNSNAGHYGHCHSPGDTHTDPGPMPPLTGITLQAESITKAGFLMALTDADQAEVLAHERNNSDKLDVLIQRTATLEELVANVRKLVYGLGSVPAEVLNKPFTLPDGTTTNLAGILTAIHATPSVAAAGDPQGVVRALATQLAK